MNRRSLILSFLTIGIALILLFLPYIEFFEPEDKMAQEDQLIDHFNTGVLPLHMYASALVFLFPIILSIESFFWGLRRNTWSRVVLLIQAALMLWGTYVIWFVMSFNIFVGPYEFKTAFYLILAYLIIGPIWSLLLSIPLFDKNRLISTSFTRLSQSEE